MPNLVRLWMEDLAVRSRDNGIPIQVGTAGMDQVSTAGKTKQHPQPVDWEAMEEIAEIKRKLTGRPHSEDLTDKEVEKLEKRLEELQAELRLSPDPADSTYGLRVVPVTKDQTAVDLKPRDLEKE